MSNSLNPESVFSELRNVSTQNLSLIKNAEIKLKEWETISGFHTVLLRILTDYSLETTIRWQAVLYFKNGVDRYWRRTASDRISDNEKGSLREGLLQCFHEPVHSVALQVAVLIGKIARFDVPKDWPELLPKLTQGVQSPNPLLQHRSLLVLHHTIKNLSTKRLLADRLIFHDLIEEILPFVCQLWKAHHETFIQQISVQGNEELSSSCLDKSILAFKILRQSVVQGLRNPIQNSAAKVFLNSLHQQIILIYELRNKFPSLTDSLEKYIVLHLQILHDLLETHPFSFLPLLQPTLELLCRLCFTSVYENRLFKRFVIICLNIMKQVLLCIEYQPPKHYENSEVVNIALILQGHDIIAEFFDPETVTEICKKIITQYLPLTHEDLTLWDNDPEEYACEDGGDSWKYSYRPCIESAYSALFHKYRDILAPIVTEILVQNSEPTDSSNLNAILYKDAVYNAIGLSAFNLYNEIDFDQWLINGLEKELSIKDSNYRIIRRRIVWLIGAWSGVKLSTDLRPKLYQIILPLLQSEEDLVVRLSTAKALKVIIVDFEFSSEELEPYLGVAFGQLFGLLKEVKECDTKLCVLDVLSSLIQRMDVSIRSFCHDLLQYLPSLWDASSDHIMLRCSIITTLVYIVQGLGSSCQELFPSFLQPIIRLSTNLKEPCSVYFLEDGLDLWRNVLYNSKSMTEPLFSLSSSLPSLLELGSENLRTILYIVHAYVLISPNEFITTLGGAINDTLKAQIYDLQDEGVLHILQLVELILRAGPQSSPHIFKSLILCSLRAIYKGNDYPLLLSVHLSILSRLIMSYPKEFNDMSVELSVELSKHQEEIASRILDVWLNKMSYVTQLERRKLLALALCSLLTLGSSVVLDKVFAIFLNVTEALNDITKPENGSYTDLLLSSAVEDDVDYETEHDTRKRLLASSDPIHTIDLRNYFQTQITGLNTQIGYSRYSDIMSQVDVETLANMKEFITI